MDLKDLILLSNKYGSNPDLILAGGGNTSVKDANNLYIKCSGVSLGTIDADGFVPVSREPLGRTLTTQYPEDDAGREAAFLKDVMAARAIPGETRRPSVEAMLHNLFEQRYVVHLHPALVNGLTCGKDGKSRMSGLFGDKAVWVPATRPGLMLGRLCHRMMSEYKARTGRSVQLAFLENHGVFVAGDTPQEADAILVGVMDTLKAALTHHPDSEFTQTPPPGAPEKVKSGAGSTYLEFRSSPQILEYLRSREAAVDLMAPFTPDQIVYCGPKHTYVKDVSQIDASAGKIIFIENTGVLALGQTEKEAALAMLLFLDAFKIAVYARSFGGAQPLSDELIQFIAYWEAEAYRQKEAKK